MMQEADKALVAKVLREGEFNELYLRCIGQHVLIKLNGQTTVDKVFPELPLRGRIGWQLHRGSGFEVFIKDIEFQELSKLRGAK